jgi:hypothetical protein
MRQLIVKQLDYDLTPVAGLALVGHYLKTLQPGSNDGSVAISHPGRAKAGVAVGQRVARQ